MVLVPNIDPYAIDPCPPPGTAGWSGIHLSSAELQTLDPLKHGFPKKMFSEMYGNDDEMISFALYCGTPCPCFGQSHILQPELKQGKCIVRPESSSIACGSPTAAIQLLPP
jgi:hypothetical protein